MMRPTVPDETADLIEIARGTEVFRPLELSALREVLDDYHAREQGNGHRSLTFEAEGRPAGFAYYAPASMTDRGWYLYWIAVAKPIQVRGIGSRLLQAVEEDIDEKGGRVLWIETSSLPHYDPTRRFYLKHGYIQASRLADFYADGDDLVVFQKRFR